MHEGEFWQEYDVRGTRILNGGLKAHSDEKPEGYYAGVSVMLYRYVDGKVEFLFQKRSKFVDFNAEKWDVSAGGHMNYQELALDAMKREAKEEIGIDINVDKLEFAAKYQVWTDRIVYLYFYDTTDEAFDFHFDDKEVEEVRWIKYKEYEKFAEEAPIKQSLRTDAVFALYLEKWQERIKNKYGNLQANR